MNSEYTKITKKKTTTEKIKRTEKIQKKKTKIKNNNIARVTDDVASRFSDNNRGCFSIVRNLQWILALALYSENNNIKNKSIVKKRWKSTYLWPHESSWRRGQEHPPRPPARHSPSGAPPPGGRSPVQTPRHCCASVDTSAASTSSSSTLSRYHYEELGKCAITFPVGTMNTRDTTLVLSCLCHYGLGSFMLNASLPYFFCTFTRFRFGSIRLLRLLTTLS